MLQINGKCVYSEARSWVSKSTGEKVAVVDVYVPDPDGFRGGLQTITCPTDLPGGIPETGETFTMVVTASSWENSRDVTYRGVRRLDNASNGAGAIPPAPVGAK